MSTSLRITDILQAENGAKVFLLNGPGNTWVNFSKGLAENASVTSIVAHQKKLIIGTYSHGIFSLGITSADWKPAVGLPKGVRIYSLAVSGTLVLATTKDHGIFISADAGNSWESRNEGLGDLNIRTIAVNAENIYAGTDASGVFYSKDKGMHWQKLNLNLPFRIQVYDIDFKGSKLIVATNLGIYEGDEKVLTNIYPYATQAVHVLDDQILAKDFNGTVELLYGQFQHKPQGKPIHFSKKKSNDSGWLISEASLNLLFSRDLKETIIHHTGKGLPEHYEVIDFENVEGKVFAAVVPIE